MYTTLRDNYFRIPIVLLLIMVMAVNTGFQYASLTISQVQVLDICDHTDGETECDKKEKGETDDIIKHDPKGLFVIDAHTSIRRILSILNNLQEHLETVTPPPEFRV